MTGRPARGIANRVMREVGPISPDAPAFPHAATALAPLKAAAEKLGKVDFTNLWAGQAVRLGREMPAAELTRALAGDALSRMAKLVERIMTFATHFAAISLCERQIQSSTSIR